MDNLLRTKLREHALVLRRLSASLRGPNSPTQSEKAIMACLRAKKEALLKEVYTILSCLLGTPIQPNEKFVWDYYDDGGKFGTWEGTPIEFYKAFTSKTYPVCAYLCPQNSAHAHLPVKPSDMISLIHDPRNELSKLYTIDKLGNVWGGRPILCKRSPLVWCAR
jgi:bleomycin hydrolase